MSAFVIDAFAGDDPRLGVLAEQGNQVRAEGDRPGRGAAAPPGPPDRGDAVHHADAGSQYTSLRFAQTLMLQGLTGSTGSVGDAYDNALAETTIGLYKSECTRDGSPFRDGLLTTGGDVEKITAAWVHWYNTSRLMHRTGLLPPAEADAAHWNSRRPDLPVARPACRGAGLDMGPSRAATPGHNGRAAEPRPGAGQGYGRPPHVKPGSRCCQPSPRTHRAVRQVKSVRSRHWHLLVTRTQVCTGAGDLQTDNHLVKRPDGLGVWQSVLRSTSTAASTSVAYSTRTSARRARDAHTYSSRQVLASTVSSPATARWRFVLLSGFRLNSLS